MKDRPQKGDISNCTHCHKNIIYKECPDIKIFEILNWRHIDTMDMRCNPDERPMWYANPNYEEK